MTTNLTIAQQLEKIAEITGGKAWGLAQGKPRVYLPSRRDIKLFLSFEGAAFSSPDQMTDGVTTGLFGVKLNCFIDDCGQPTNWYKSQKAKAMEGARGALNAAMWFDHTGNADEAKRFADEELTISDEAASHLINGREAEARAAVGL